MIIPRKRILLVCVKRSLASRGFTNPQSVERSKTHHQKVVGQEADIAFGIGRVLNHLVGQRYQVDEELDKRISMYIRILST